MVDLPEGPYRLSLVPIVKEQMRASAARAKTPEVREQFLEALGARFARLAVDPGSAGDPIRNYEKAGIREYRWVQDRVLIGYGVDEENRIVYVKECRPVLNHPLALP